jgi:hypothetical protein
LPRTRLVRVAGIFSLGLLEYDAEIGFVSLDFARTLLSKDQPDLIQLKVSDIYQAPAIAATLPKRPGPQLPGARLGGAEPAALLGAVAGEDGDLGSPSASSSRWAR